MGLITLAMWILGYKAQTNVDFDPISHQHVKWSNPRMKPMQGTACTSYIGLGPELTLFKVHSRLDKNIDLTSGPMSAYPL